MRMRVLVVVLGLLSLSFNGWGTISLEFQSSYLGDGWFRYRFKNHLDPFFLSVDYGDLGVTPFTNRVEYGPDSADWVVSSGTNQNTAFWHWTPGSASHQVRPYEREFFVRSAERTYRLSTNAIALFSLVLVSDWFRYWASQGITTENMVGYMWMPCLSPCSPGQADGSPPEFNYIFRFNEEVLLNDLVMTDGLVHGVKFTWSRTSTMLLQASADHLHWTNVAYLYGNAGTTTWTTNQPLNPFGNFFRLQLVAVDEHVTNLPPLNVVSAAPLAAELQSARRVLEQPTVQVRGCFLEGREMVVRFVSEGNMDYLVSVMDLAGNTVLTRNITGTGTEIEARFRADSLPSTACFKVEAVQ